MSFLNLMRNRLKPKEVNEALMDVEDRVLPVTSSAFAGQILKLTGENKTPSWADEYSYTPPTYSETETATGQKWIDGKDVYLKVFTGKTPTTDSIDIVLSFDSIVLMTGTVLSSSGSIYDIIKIVNINGRSNKTALVMSAPATIYQETDYTLIIYYTKPDPTPGSTPEYSEPEIETKKTTRKKKETNN